MVYIGQGGAIDGKVNPILTAVEGQRYRSTLINGEGAEHDIVFPDQDTKSPRVTGKGASTTIAFRADKSGDFVYFCSVPGHRIGGHARTIHRHAASTALRSVVEADISREIHRRAAADRQARPANRSGRPQCGRARRSARGRDDVRLLDLQRQRARTDPPRACRRHR